MIDVMGSALVNLLTGWHLFYMMVGVLVGVVIGVLPALGGIAGMSILLPFIYGMDQVSALGMLIGLVAVTPTGDTFTSVMMGIPGSSASQATILDGFPLAKKGEAARALSAAFFSSLIGGVFGAIVLTIFVLVARPVILLFSSAELFMLTLLGLGMVGVLSGSSLAKGVTCCGIGLLLGTVGAAPATGEYRMTFGTGYLSDGISVVVVGLGLFAVPEIVDLLRRSHAIAEVTALGKGWIDGMRDTLKHWGLVLRCSGIGCLIGAMPGLGGAVAEWVAYGHVVQTARDKSNFGKGDIRGVLAPESANNSVQGGALIPTLLFGIPATGTMALFLGGMVLLGIQPGITMIDMHLDLTYTIIWSLALANVIGAGICILISKPVALLTTLPYVYLAPFMIMIIFFAAFQATVNWGDLIGLFVVGTFAVYMRRFGWPRPPMLIGFVLAPSAETYLYQAVQFYGWNWLLRPGAIIIGLITLISVWLGARYGSKRINEGGESGTVRIMWPQIMFATVVAALFAYGIYHSRQWSFLGKIFPLSISAIMLCFALYVLGVNLAGKRDHPINFDTEADNKPGAIAAIEHYIGWLAGLLLATALVGFVLGTGLFFAAFLASKARAPVLRNGVLTASAVVFLAFMSYLFNLDFPRGLLQDFVEMPWPFN